MSTNKQVLAQKRNWLKYRLAGTYIHITGTESLTEEERISINAINNLRTQLIANFDRGSKELGLKVPDHRCWCGKPAKVEVDYYNNGNLMWVCNKHNEKL